MPRRPRTRFFIRPIKNTHRQRHARDCRTKARHSRRPPPPRVAVRYAINNTRRVIPCRKKVHAVISQVCRLCTRFSSRHRFDPDPDPPYPQFLRHLLLQLDAWHTRARVFLLKKRTGEERRIFGRKYIHVGFEAG